MLLLLSPWIIGFCVFTAVPMVLSLYYSFTHYDILTTPRWVGLDNYRYMFGVGGLGQDPNFWLSVKNTLWIIVFGVPLRIFFGIITAMLLVRPKRGNNVYRTLFFMPSMAPKVGAALVFVYLFNPVTGPINRVLDSIPGVDRAALVLRPDLGEAGAPDHGAVGDRRRDRDLHRRACSTCRASCTRRSRSRARTAGSGSAT